MSHEVNTKLLEEAAEWIDVFTNTTLGDMLEFAVESNDLEAVYHLVKRCRIMEMEAENADTH